MTAGQSQKSTENESSGTLSPAPVAPIRQNERDYQEFLTRTKNIFFVRDSLASVEAQRADDMATPHTRVAAWARRNAWGRFRFHCLNEDGTIARQKDCVAALGINKGTVSKAFALLEARGVIELRDNRIFPVLEPELKPVPGPGKEEGWSDFIEKHWTPANPDTARRLDAALALEKQARDIRRAIVAAQREAFGSWATTGEVSAQQLLPGSLSITLPESAFDLIRTLCPDNPDTVSAQQPATQLSPVSAAPYAELERPEPPVFAAPPSELERPEVPPYMGLDRKTGVDGQTAVRPSAPPPVTPTLNRKDAHRTRIRELLKSHMRDYRMNTYPDNLIIEEIADLLRNDNAFWGYAGELRKMIGRGRPNSWKWFVTIADKVGAVEMEPDPENPEAIVKIEPQSEEDMFAALRRSGETEETIEHLRAKAASDRARLA